MLKSHFAFTAIAVSIALVSCKPTIKDLNAYQKKAVTQTEFMPSEEQLAKNVPTVVILPFSDSTEFAKQTNFSTQIPNKLEKVLVSNKLASIAPRDAFVKLADEIKMAELNNQSTSSINANGANYAIVGDVSNVSFSSEDVTSESEPTNNVSAILAATGKRDRIYRYTSALNASVKIYELPTLKLIDSIIFDGSATNNEKAKIKKDTLLSREFEDPKTFDANVVMQALENAVNRHAVELKNTFAKTGYVSEVRNKGSKIIAKISLGSADGLKHGDKIILQQKYTSEDSLSGKSVVDTKVLGQAIVTNQITANAAWVVVPEEVAKELKIGDVAKVFYKNGLFTVSK